MPRGRRPHHHINRFYWSLLASEQKQDSIKSRSSQIGRRRRESLYLLDVTMPSGTVKTAHGDAMPRSICVPSGITGARASAAYGARDQDCAAERPAQSLEPADQIDGRADRGEIQ